MTEPTVERTPIEEAWILALASWDTSQRLADEHPEHSRLAAVDFVKAQRAVEEAIRADERSKWESAVQDALVDAFSLSSTGLMLAALERRLRSLLDPKDETP